eukprot:scpid104542/ scgid11980/ 
MLIPGHRFRLCQPRQQAFPGSCFLRVRFVQAFGFGSQVGTCVDVYEGRQIHLYLVLPKSSSIHTSAARATPLLLLWISNCKVESSLLGNLIMQFPWFLTK